LKKNLLGALFCTLYIVRGSVSRLPNSWVELSDSSFFLALLVSWIQVFFLALSHFAVVIS
jgi:hypothetical protein